MCVYDEKPWHEKITFEHRWLKTEEMELAQ